MKRLYTNMDKILNNEKWQKLQDSLAHMTKMAIITVDYKGIPITRHSGRQPFCDHVRNDPELEQYCHKCDSRGGLEAARINAPYYYLCHCNIVDIAVPIVVHGNYMGAIMMGQIRLPAHEDTTVFEQILISPAKNIFDSEKLQRLYQELPVLPRETIQETANMLYDLCNYLVEEAINKDMILDTYEQILGRGASSHGHLNNLSLDNVRQVKKAMDHVITRAHVSKDTERYECKTPVLRPAFDYIFESKGEAITQTQMADLCHISTSHFSRLFAKEVGESFSSFLARLKVEWAKQLLERTDFSVTQISDALGFGDPGYFIKTFKKYENLTPASYRKYSLAADNTRSGED